MYTTEVCNVSWKFSPDSWEETVKTNLKGSVWLRSGWDQIAGCNDRSACIEVSCKEVSDWPLASEAILFRGANYFFSWLNTWKI